MRRASAEWATRDSRRLFSAPCARPRDAPARSGQRAIRDAFLLPPARIRETRQRGVGNARFAALFSAPCARLRNAPARSGQRAIRGAFPQSLARIRETRQRGAGNARFAVLSFSPLRASVRRASVERATRDSRRLSSALRARPRDAPARSGQRAIRSGFFQLLARVYETCQRGAGNARFAALSFSPLRASDASTSTACSPSPLRASARRASAEWATRDSRRLSSAPRAHPRDAPARSGQRANRGGFFQPLARVRETRQRGAGNVRFATLSFCPPRASGRRASAE